MRFVGRAICGYSALFFGCGCIPAFADCTTNMYTQPAPSQFLASFAPNCVFGYAPTLLFMRDQPGSSYPFGSSDFYQQTNRTNSGTAMTDTLPATGLVTGTMIQIRNADASATDTITPTTYKIEGSSSDTILPGQTVEYVFDASLTTPQWWKVLNSGAQATFGTTTGNTVGDVVQMATTGVGVTDSEVGINTSGPNLCPVNANCAFSNLASLQFSGVTASNGQDINDEKGTCYSLSTSGPGQTCTWFGVQAEFSLGIASYPITNPNGPLIRASVIHSGAAGACGGNPVEGSCTAPIMGFAGGDANDNLQEVGIRGAAQTATTQMSTNNLNAIGGGFEGRVVGSGIYDGIGVAVGGRRDTATGGIQGAQITANNNVSSNCGVHVNGPGPCNGIWLVGESPGGGYDVGTGLHIAGPFLEGITINGAADSGDGACCGTIAIHDDSQAPIGLEEDGTHTMGAINITSGAGDVLLGANSIYNVAKVSSAPSSSLSSGFLVTSGVSGSLANSGAFYPYASDANTGVGSSASNTLTAYANVSGAATDIADFSSTGFTVNSGNVVARAGDFITRASQAAPQVTASGDTTTGFYQSASGVWNFASGGTNITRWNSSGTTINGYVMVGSITNLMLYPGDIGLIKQSPGIRSNAPGASGAKISVICGTNTGTARIVAYAGTSNTSTTLADNIGGGVSGC